MTIDPGKFKNKYRIASARLKGWDYTTAGYYFITICTRERIAYFGDVINGEMRLSTLGEFADKYWRGIPDHFPHVTLDEFVIMPNHVHGIIVINSNDFSPVVVVETQDCVETQGDCVETQHAASLQMGSTQPASLRVRPGSVSVIVRSYKSAVRRWAGLNNHHNFAWQERFYDHIIRDEKSLENIRMYILANPGRWDTDEYYA